jgi:glutathione reductase (NADPH)
LENFDFDLFVIGAGSAGVRACRIASSLGARVAVAEERYFGGTCVNVGCVPKKLFSYAAHYRDDYVDSKGFGWSHQGLSFDWATLKRNKDIEINRLNGIYKTILDDNDVQVFEARATVRSPHEIVVERKTVTCKYILICVGGWPWTPAFPGSELTISSNDIFEMEELPESMVIVGGGYIAVEFASIFTRLGCKTTLIYRRDMLLRGFDEEVRQFITTQISHDLDLKLGTSISKILKNENQLQVTCDNGEEMRADKVLYATGRRPATANLGLEALGMDLADNGAIMVNASFQSSVPNIYAAGDVIDRVALTPVGLAEGEVVARNLFAGPGHEVSYENIATAVFCHPNIGTVGLSEEEAFEQGLKVDIYSSQVKLLKHTLGDSKNRSFVKLVVDQTTDQVLGLHIVAPDAGEIVQGFAVALNCGATKADFDRTIGIHPTLAEEFVTMRKLRVHSQRVGRA